MEVKKTSLLVVTAVLILAALTAVPAFCQPGQGGGQRGGRGQMGPGGPPGMGMQMQLPPPPQTTMVVADGVLYIACDGKVTAFEAKTLNKLAEATYLERPAPPKPGEGPGMGPGGQAPPPPAPEE